MVRTIRFHTLALAMMVALLGMVSGLEFTEDLRFFQLANAEHENATMLQFRFELGQEADIGSEVTSDYFIPISALEALL